ncbi:MAG: hypothetical protein G01um101472_638, partial [Parcubacteria group bacterium Gr01-1014_72]
SSDLSRDTGISIFRAFHTKLRSECLTPVIVRRLHFGALANLLYWPNKCLEFFLPDRLCFIPKRRHYSTTQRFRDFGLPDIVGAGCEEYFFRGKPFALHLRGTQTKIAYSESRDFERDYAMVLRTFEAASRSMKTL